MAFVMPLILAAAFLEAAAVDRFGVARLYPDAPDGIAWVSAWDGGKERSFRGVDPEDDWFDADHGNARLRVDGEGQLLVSGPVPRMYIHDPQRKRSWRNVEMTVYAKRVDDEGTPWAGIVGVARSAHGIMGPLKRFPCDSRGLGARMRYDGRVDFEKETSHPNATPAGSKRLWRVLPRGVWIGYKFVVYDLPNGNVKLEHYLDMSDGSGGGSWTKINELEDNGRNFGVRGEPCRRGIDPGLRLSAGDSRPGSESGKPNITVYFRSDNVGRDGLIYKKMSVREISPIEPGAVKK